MKNPTEKELIQTVDLNVIQAAGLVTQASLCGFFTRKEGDEMLELLQKATAAMTELHCSLRGVPPPVIGP